MTKQEIWQSMDKPTQTFTKAMIEAGLTIRAIKTKAGVWREQRKTQKAQSNVS